MHEDNAVSRNKRKGGIAYYFLPSLPVLFYLADGCKYSLRVKTKVNTAARPRLCRVSRFNVVVGGTRLGEGTKFVG